MAEAMIDIEPPAPAPSAPRLAAPLDAWLGFELESSVCQVLPFTPKSTALLRGRGWTLETDKIPGVDSSHLEFVVDPLRSWQEAERVADEVVQFSALLREMALSRQDRMVSLAEFEPWRQYDVVAEYREHRIKVRHRHMVARLQSTFGVGLAKLHEAITLIYGPVPAGMIEVSASRVRDAYSRRAGALLSPDAAGFVHLVCFYLYCSRKARIPATKQTVHINFRLFPRSDFCSAFQFLLGDDERRQVRDLLLPDPLTDRTPLLEALGLAESALVFGSPYYTRSYDLEAGPLIRDWFSSIVRGRGDGAFQKDLMSPPPGYSLHTGNLARDYGAGAMGVDPGRRLVLFECRSALHRHDLPLNAVMKQLMLIEYRNAHRFNPALQPPPAAYGLSTLEFQSHNAVECAFRCLDKVCSGVRAAVGDGQEWKRQVTRRSVTAMLGICRLQALMARDGLAVPELERIAREMIPLGTVLGRAPEAPDPVWVADVLPGVVEKLQACERALWAIQSRLG